MAPAALSVVRGTTSRLPRRATSSPTTSSAILSNRCRLGCVAAHVLPGRSRLQRGGLVGHLGVVHMQRPARGVALLVRQTDLRAAARPALPDPGHRRGIDLGQGCSGGIQLSLLVFGRHAGRSHRYITDTRPNSPPSRIQGYDKESSARRQCVGYRCGHRHNNTFVRGRASQRRPDAEPPVPNHPSGSGRGACPRTDGTYGRGGCRSAHRGRRTQRRPGRDGDGTAPTLNAGAPLTRAWLQRSTAQVG